MAYATIADIQARNAARGTYSANTTPTASQVAGFIFDSAAQLDQWLYAGGYDAPFDRAIASGVIGTSAVYLLRRWNAAGAVLMVEESAISPMNLDAFQKMWEEIKTVILDKTVDIPLPVLGSKDHPRGPGVPGSLAPNSPDVFTFGPSPRPRSSSYDL